MAIEGRSDAKGSGRIRLGMVGGGQGAFIGAVHRLAARMDDQYEFVAGALSSDAARSKASGEESARNDSTSSGSGGRPVKSKQTRRRRVRRSASGDNFSVCVSSFFRIRRSIGFRA